MRPPDTVRGEDGLYGTNPMTTALRQRKEVGEGATRQAQSEETDALVDELSRAKARKDAAWDTELAQKSAYDSQRLEAEFQALASQRTAPKRGRLLGAGKGARSRIGS